MMNARSTVSVYKCKVAEYPETTPFHPDQHFPEYAFGSDALGASGVYGAVRQTLAMLGLDEKNFGTPQWNPLSAILRPGQRVVIKPNLVVSEHELGLSGLVASVAHGSVIRPIVDYAFRAVGESGHITIADSPIKEVDFEKITWINGLQGIVAFYQSRGIPIQLLDLRDLQAYRDARGVILEYRALAGDPLGYTTVDLGSRSMLASVPLGAQSRFRSTAAIYENEAVRHHSSTLNEYSMPNTILQADALISIAKMKVHRKAGVTLSLKNMVGTTNEKRWLPHHRAATPADGGDMVPDGATLDRKVRERLADLASRSRNGKFLHVRAYPFLAWFYRCVIRPWFDLRARGDSTQDFREGDWFGNDTIWRTILDLNMVVRYADRHGKLNPIPQRSYLSLIDGIIGGEKEGPLHPSPKESGLLVAGLDPVAVDLVSATLMGFSPQKLPTIANASSTALSLGSNRPDRIDLRANQTKLLTWDGLRTHSVPYIPSAGWSGHIEDTREEVESAIFEPATSLTSGAN